MSGFVYIWKDRKHNKFYIGSHWGNEDDRYICSSRIMRDNYRYRPTDFNRRIVARITTNRHDLLFEEQRWLDMIPKDEFGRKYYNITSKADKAYWWMNEETKKVVGERITKSKLGKKWKGEVTEDFRQKMRVIALDKIAKQGTLGGKPTWNRGLVGYNNGHFVSEETKRKISASEKGKIVSEETRVKMSLGQKRRWATKTPQS